jgi:hypothetical protein
MNFQKSRCRVYSLCAALTLGDTVESTAYLLTGVSSYLAERLHHTLSKERMTLLWLWLMRNAAELLGIRIAYHKMWCWQKALLALVVSATV